MPIKKIQHYGILNFIGSIGSLLLSMYLLHTWEVIPFHGQFNGTKWTISITSCILFIMSGVYMLLACLMLFRVAVDIPLQNAKLLKVLHFENSINNLGIVWHASGLWVTPIQKTQKTGIGLPESNNNT